MLAPPVVEGEVSEDTQFPQTSVPIPNVAHEAVFKEWDDRVVRATNTAASLDAAHASGGNTPRSDEERIEQDDLMDFVPPTPHDLPLSRGHTPESDEGRPNINELTAIYTNLSNRVLALEQSKTAQDLIGTSKRKSLDEEYVSKHGRKSDKTKPMFDDSDFVELDVDNAMENVEGDTETQGRNTAKQSTTVGDTVNTTSIDVSAAGPSNVSTSDPSTITAGDIFKDEMMTIADTLVAIRSTRPRKTLLMICDVEKEPRRATPIPTVQSQDKEIQKLYESEQNWINDFVPIDSEVVKDSRKGKAEGSRQKTVARKRTSEKLDDESVKKQKIEDDAEKEALRAYLDIISGDDEVVNVESLATKYLIVDWKTHALSEDKMYYDIIRGDGSTKSHKIFTEMLDDFNRQDVLDLYRLVKERFKTASPEGYDRLLWEISLLVHVLLMDTGIAIHMLIEKTYPLTQEMLSRMLSRRLEVDHECEMAYELLRGGLLGIRDFYDLMLLVQVCAVAED
ncbi:hypothetical protein Tco_1387794 [Tanacetum coccineum]